MAKKPTPEAAPFEITKLSDITPDGNNYNKGTAFGTGLIERSLQTLGAGRSVLADMNGRMIAGNKTLQGLISAGWNDDDVIVVRTDGSKLVVVQRTDLDLDTERGREMALADNATAKANIEWDHEALARDHWTPEKLGAWGVSPWGAGGVSPGDNEAGDGDTGNAADAEARLSLAERFLIPPFSVFDTRQGYWQDRKRKWLALGIKSELGRGGAMTYNDHDWQREKLGTVQAPMGTLGAIPPNERSIMRREGSYKTRGGGQQNGSGQRPEATQKKVR